MLTERGTIFDACYDRTLFQTSVSQYDCTSPTDSYNVVWVYMCVFNSNVLDENDWKMWFPEKGRDLETIGTFSGRSQKQTDTHLTPLSNIERNYRFCDVILQLLGSVSDSHRVIGITRSTTIRKTVTQSREEGWTFATIKPCVRSLPSPLRYPFTMTPIYSVYPLPPR